MEREMTTHQRMTCLFDHRPADRAPVIDSPWPSTLERWHREGLPENVHFADYLGMDRFTTIEINTSPRYPENVIEDTDDYIIKTTDWGATLKNYKHHGSVPEFLDFTITGPQQWAEAKKRMQPDADRVDWGWLEQNYSKARQSGAWITAQFWFGFDVTHSWMVGTERTLMAMAMDPDWIVDFWNHQLDMDIALFQMIWDRGYTFDSIHWYDDMGYKGKQFFSVDMYRDLLKPVHKKACDWAHAKGVKVHLHSCGDIRPFVSEFVDIGIDMLNPLEVKAGVDPLALKKTYGDRLAFHGGLNAVLYETPEALWEEMARVIPAMKEMGGYLISTDHSVPDSVSLDKFKHFVQLAKKLGSYS